MWRLSGFTELRELGSGAQGRVVLARRDDTGAVYAIKYVYAATASNEAALLRTVDDPHVARLYHYVEQPGEGAALIMEAVDGVSLRAVLDEHGMLTPEASLVVLKGSLLGLAAAHARGVIHRDYKPANVVVRDDGQSKLIDFGIAVVAGSAGGSGTPAYMSPEQWLRGPAGPSTDVYAATCVFFECVTGRQPYRGDVSAGHLNAPVPAEEAPEQVRPLIFRGMAKTAERRPADAATFVDELEEVAGQAYGPDWERRGLIALGGSAASLAAASLLSAGSTGAAQAGTRSTARTMLHGGRPVAVKITAATVAAVLVVGGAILYQKTSAKHPAPRRVAAAADTAWNITFQNTPATPLRAVATTYSITARYPVLTAGIADPARRDQINRLIQQPITDWANKAAANAVISNKQAAQFGNEKIPPGNVGEEQTTVTQAGLLVTIKYRFDSGDNILGGDDRLLVLRRDTATVLPTSGILTPQATTRQGVKRITTLLNATAVPKGCPHFRPQDIAAHLKPSKTFAVQIGVNANGLRVIPFPGAQDCVAPGGTSIPFTKLVGLVTPAVIALAAGRHPA